MFVLPDGVVGHGLPEEGGGGGETGPTVNVPCGS